jgi:LmbE family N-acetylglucosaminyl deacetylase
MIGAHPDDCDLMTGGTALLFADLGHQVKFISATNGNAGHHIQGGLQLTTRRYAEAQKAASVAGIEYELLDNDDGRLIADIRTRAMVLTRIRQFAPDLVITHRPNDYHPDHRNTSILVQDSSYLVMAQNVCQLIPALDYQPIILYMRDQFQKPQPFQADIVIDIDSVIDRKIKMISCHESQVFEWLPHVMKNGASLPSGKQERLAWLKEVWGSDDMKAANRFRGELAVKYGSSEGAAVRYMEAFEICEYGGELKKEEFGKYFPF